MHELVGKKKPFRSPCRFPLFVLSFLSYKPRKSENRKRDEKRKWRSRKTSHLFYFKHLAKKREKEVPRRGGTRYRLRGAMAPPKILKSFWPPIMMPSTYLANNLMAPPFSMHIWERNELAFLIKQPKILLILEDTDSFALILLKWNSF